MKKTTFRSRPRGRHRVRLRIPWIIEVEGEGLVAVVGSLLLVAVITTFELLSR
jgi:hypothetical protein